ncbi:ferric reductase NAD binding domain-containing protein [Coniochaeta sp. 2T2.1]|nr:ferric reductase NAD binding domain-containing protein [Coniochaeta sp. 2T2.1]
MKWPYVIVNQPDEVKHARRILLDRYGFYAQLSAVAVIICLQLVPLGRWIVKKATARSGAEYDAVPTADAAKRQKPNRRSWWISRTYQRGHWWLGDEVRIANCTLGRRDEWFFGGLWAAWLLFLCVNQTGTDYHHLTKRFGQIAVSQFPLQYLLATKRLNPVAFAFRTSHENVNRWHRVLGSITYTLALLHGAFYLNFYIQIGGLGRAFGRLVPVLGMLGFISMTLLSSTAMGVVRRWSYRVFVVTHLVVAFAMPFVIWFHVHHARTFMGEAGLVYVADVVWRFCATVKASAVVEFVPGTELIKVVAKVPQGKGRKFGGYPGGHAYLSLKGRWRAGLICNPFTVAAVGEETGELMFVIRRRDGPLSNRLAELAKTQATGTGVKLNVDGPYGVSAHFPNLAGPEFEQVLLVAGGVGATFILPLYEHILAENAAANVKLIWAVRDADEVSWPVLASGGGITDDARVELFVTSGCRGSSSSDVTEPGDIEMESLEKASGSSVRVKIPRYNHKRPDLQGVVGDAFQDESRGLVAVVVCGPAGMARDVRKAVGFWVEMGKDVWFHNESFGW